MQVKPPHPRTTYATMNPRFSNKTEAELLAYKAPKRASFLSRLGRLLHISKYRKQGGGW